ncbi:MAG: 2-hydroxymuconate tautomerase family protein [Acidimicrobiia bacterium]|nr:2-hydroxymuconate tautomerase family protein [Acidimicrobiia bacterium]
MPIVTVNLMEGRSPEQIENMIAEVSEALVRSLDAPIETVRIMVNEMAPYGFGIAGRSARLVMAERQAADATASTEGQA